MDVTRSSRSAAPNNSRGKHTSQTAVEADLVAVRLASQFQLCERPSPLRAVVEGAQCEEPVNGLDKYICVGSRWYEGLGRSSASFTWEAAGGAEWRPTQDMGWSRGRWREMSLADSVRVHRLLLYPATLPSFALTSICQHELNVHLSRQDVLRLEPAPPRESSGLDAAAGSPPFQLPPPPTIGRPARCRQSLLRKQPPTPTPDCQLAGGR